MEQPDVLCLGETMVMVTPTEPTALEDGEEFYLSVGGAESTVAMYLAESGFRTAWVSSLGRDPLGTRILRTVEKYGVDTSYVHFDDAPTGVYFKDPGQGSTRVYYYRRGSAASLMSTALLDSLPLAGARLVHASGITPGLSRSCREMMAALPERLRASGTKFSFDVNYRQGVWPVETAAPLLLDLARQADYVFVGLDEAAVLWGTTDPRSIYDLLRPVGTLVVKDGAVGATELDGAAEVFVATPAVRVVEEVGAGDAFAAGYLSSVLDGGKSNDALLAGHRMAARSLQSTSDFAPLAEA